MRSWSILRLLATYTYSSSVKQSLSSVNHEQFPMQMTQQAQQVAPNPRPGRFSTETPLEGERGLQIQREKRRRRRQQETAQQKEHRLAQQRQRRQQEIGIRGIMILLHCRKPTFLSLPVSPPIYRSKSVSALYYGPKNNNFQANCTRPYLCFVFVFL